MKSSGDDVKEREREALGEIAAPDIKMSFLCLGCIMRREMYERAKLTFPRSFRRTAPQWPFKKVVLPTSKTAKTAQPHSQSELSLYTLTSTDSIDDNDNASISRYPLTLHSPRRTDGLTVSLTLCIALLFIICVSLCIIICIYFNVF